MHTALLCIAIAQRKLQRNMTPQYLSIKKLYIYFFVNFKYLEILLYTSCWDYLKLFQKCETQTIVKLIFPVTIGHLVNNSCSLQNNRSCVE